MAEDDSGEVAGFAGLREVDGTADVQTIAVVPSHQRQGLGTTLLDALSEEARRRRAREMLLEVRADNEPAIAFYQRHGFERIARRRGYYAAGRVDGLVLRRRNAVYREMSEAEAVDSDGDDIPDVYQT